MSGNSIHNLALQNAPTLTDFGFNLISILLRCVEAEFELKGGVFYDKVEVTKLYKQTTKCSLSEAKEVVDLYYLLHVDYTD